MKYITVNYALTERLRNSAAETCQDRFFFYFSVCGEILGGLINGGGLISGWAYKRNKKNVSERRDKTYLRNELKLTYHYISSYIYNTFVVRHNKRNS